ncbi:hypothetical protein JHK82_035079 [Glycine max]|nr:hypothetical protein JHK82_035079 [Glycine max]
MLEKVREFSVDKVIQEIELLTRDAERVHREPLKRILEDNQQSTCRVWVSMEALTVRISRHVFNAYRKLNKHFQHLERENEDLKKIHEAHLVDFVLETTSVDDVQDTSICEEVKALLDEKPKGCHDEMCLAQVNLA